MNKIVSEKKNNESELWINWLTRKFNSYEAFKDFALGQDPKEVAEKFIKVNSASIDKIFDNFDEEDKDTLDQFKKLTEFEWHIFRILKKQLKLRNNLTVVDFKKRKKEKKKKS